jgi:DNA replication protein DnaC
MNDDLDQLLHGLKLPRAREVIARELERARTEQPSYEEFLARVLREEYHHQRQRSLEYRIRQARLPEVWSIDTFPFDRQPGVRAATIRQLADLDFIAAAQNLVFIGPTGVGKTGLASGLLHQALVNGYRGRFIRAQDLFDEMYASLADRSTRRMLDQLKAYDVLLIDEMGYLNLRPEQSNIFFKLMEERYGKKSTILTTNLDYDDWFAFLGQKPMVQALLDRLRHKCQTLRIDGPSLRTPTG